ncbi:hypothetical protein RUM43_010803 [Polyplax serrata]|uniref:Uncharacterized protein n=1 Tax=Polyplax serrata TaxID=468196 RepID=A0AAN8PDT3_POLSC
MNPGIALGYVRAIKKLFCLLRLDDGENQSRKKKKKEQGHLWEIPERQEKALKVISDAFPRRLPSRDLLLGKSLSEISALRLPQTNYIGFYWFRTNGGGM